MDKVKRDRYFFFLATGFILGGLIGIIAFSTFISYRIDQYHHKIKTLESEIADKNARLEKLEEVINKKKLVVKEVEVTLENEEDEIAKITLQKHIKEKLDKFIGKEVNKLDGDMLWEVVDKRIMKIEDKEYKLKVNKLMISETIHIWVQVQK